MFSSFSVLMELFSKTLGTQDTLSRLAAELGVASAAVREGALARMAVREAAGWLAHQGSWVHPVDLALRAAGVTGSYTAAELGMRLPSVLPAGGEAAEAPEDRDVAAALEVGRRWLRLAILPGWVPDLPPLPEAGEPGLLAAARILAERPENRRSDRLSADAVLRAAWLWRERGGGVLPVWAAPVGMLHRLALAGGEGVLPGALDVLAEAAQAGRRVLAGLRMAEIRGAALKGTARARLPEAVGEALRRPVLTARMLAASLGLSQRGALDLVGRMEAAGFLREATGRRAWRAFVVTGAMG